MITLFIIIPAVLCVVAFFLFAASVLCDNGRRDCLVDRLGITSIFLALSSLVFIFVFIMFYILNRL
jgi:hypothetical protein